MPLFLKIIKNFVALLFIFSAFIKAIDPLGLSYKMNEFYDVWQMPFLTHTSLIGAIIIIYAEALLGISLLLNFKPKQVVFVLLLLNTFFTFLTGYASFSTQIKTCGCFGDCIPLTSQQSFIKDIILMILLAYLFYYRQKLKSYAYTKTYQKISLFTLFLFPLLIMWYVMNNLPLIDCLPYKINLNIIQQLQKENIADTKEIIFYYNKNGKEIQFKSNQFPTDFDTSYHFIKREDKVINNGTANPINDFALYNHNDKDTTLQLLLQHDKMIWLFLNQKNIGFDDKQLMQWINHKYFTNAHFNQTPLYIIVSNNFENYFNLVQSLNNPLIHCIYTDKTIMNTIARTSATLYQIEKGIIKNKYGNLSIEW